MPTAWPATLPQLFLVDGNKEQTGDGRLKSQTDTGPGKLRPRSSAVPNTLSASMMMTGDQLDVLAAFVAGGLGRGCLPFTVPKTHGDGDWLVRFAPDGLPGWSNTGGDNWSVSMGLEILP